MVLIILKQNPEILIFGPSVAAMPLSGYASILQSRGIEWSLRLCQPTVHPFFFISNWRKNRKTLYLLKFFWNPMLSNSIAYHFFETLLLSNCLIFDYFFWKMKKGLFSFKNTEKWWKLPFFKFLHQFMEKNCP